MSESEPAAGDPANVCAGCGAANAALQRFCSGCGAPLASEQPPPAGVAPRRPAQSGAKRSPPSGDSLERARARREFARVKTIVFSMRALFFACAFLAFVNVLFGFGLLRDLPRADRWIAQVFLAMVGSELLVSIVGGLLVLRAPLPWTLVAACYFTLNTALGMWLDDFQVSFAFGIRLLGVVCMWCGVAQAARVQQLMAADPTLTLRIAKVAPERAVRGGVVDQANERHRAERRRTLVQRLKWVGILLLAFVGAGFGIAMLLRAPSVDGAIERFTGTWPQGSVEALQTLFGRDQRGTSRLDEELEQRGWLTKRPELGPPTLERHEEYATARFAIGGDTLQASWQLHDRTWYLRELRLPQLVTTDHAPAIEAFRAAWATRGTDALVALFRPSTRARTGTTLVRLLTKREWHEARPALGETYPPKLQTGRCRVGFALDGDQVDVSFEYWHPQWYVVGVALPSR